MSAATAVLKGVERDFGLFEFAWKMEIFFILKCWKYLTKFIEISRIKKNEFKHICFRNKKTLKSGHTVGFGKGAGIGVDLNEGVDFGVSEDFPLVAVVAGNPFFLRFCFSISSSISLSQLTLTGGG